jgi:microcystin-dependent protein
MSEPFIGEIRMFAGTFAPRGWASANGQLVAISQNNALFALFGTSHGGDGRTTFGLPDLRGRIPIHQGTGPGLSPKSIGQKGGVEDVTMTVSELPAHTHAMQASTDVANSANPAIHVVARSPAICHWIDEAPSTAMAAEAITPAGGGQSHVNVAPFFCVNYIVSLTGIFPSRTFAAASWTETEEGAANV